MGEDTQIVEEQPLTEKLIDMLQGMNDHLSIIDNQLESKVDMLIGSAPKPDIGTGEAKTATEHDNFESRIFRIIKQCNRKIYAIEESSRRLDRVI